MTSAEAPVSRQTVYDTARAIEASSVPLDFAAAYPLCRVVLELGGGPVNVRSREMSFLDTKVVKRLERGGWLERSGSAVSQAHRVASLLNFSRIPGKWTTRATVTPGRLRADLVAASDEAIEMVAGFFREVEGGAGSLQVPAREALGPGEISNPLEPFVGSPYFLVFAREDVEACDLSAYANVLAALGSEFGRRHFRQMVVVGFAGYDDDPRELFEVPEVQRFVDVLVEALPWGYFLVPEHGGLRLLLLCLARATRESSGAARIDATRRVDVADALYREAMTAAFLVGLDDDDVARLRESISAETGVAFDDRSADDVFGDAIDERIATLLGEAEPGTLPEIEPAASRVQDLRDAWVQDRIDHLVKLLGIVGDRLVDEVRTDLGRPDLVGAVLAARVGSWLGWGLSQARVLDKLADLAVLDGRTDTRGLRRRLVETVAARMATDGLGVGDPWRPESGYLLLLEVWAVEQRDRVDAPTFAAQLRQVWGETDERALPYLHELPARALAGFRELSELVDEEDAPAAALLVSQALEQPDVESRRVSTMGAMNLAGIPHLEVVARELADAQHAARALESFATYARTSTDEHGAEGALYGRVAEDAAARLAAARSSNVDLLGGLSEYEISRLSLDSDRRFQDACLDAYVARRQVAWDPEERPRGRHGTFGGVPWWCVPVTTEYDDLVDEILEKDNAGFGLGADDGDLLTFALASPTGEGFYAFDYELDSFADVCELMLIGRSGRIGIDFDRELDGRRVRLGTVGALVADEITARLLDVATERARGLLGVESGMPRYADVREALDGYFASPRSSWSRPADHLM